MFMFPVTGSASLPSQAPPQEQPPGALGSLTTTGEAYLNDSRTDGDSTVFTGARLRTGENGIATFTVSGKGTLKVSTHSRVAFADNPQFTTVLEEGTAILSSVGGAGGITLRVGSYVLVPSTQQDFATAKIERAPDGSARLSCMEGAVEVVSLAGAEGFLLQPGQTAVISAKGEVLSVLSPPSPVVQTAKHGWPLPLAGGVAAAATAGAAGGIVAATSSKSPVSPSGP